MNVKEAIYIKQSVHAMNRDLEHHLPYIARSPQKKFSATSHDIRIIDIHRSWTKMLHVSIKMTQSKG